MTAEYPITYRCPGGLSITYVTTMPSYFARLRATWIGGVGLWYIWLREAGFLLAMLRMPWPSVIAQNITEDFHRAYRRLQWQAANDNR